MSPSSRKTLIVACMAVLLALLGWMVFSPPGQQDRSQTTSTKPAQATPLVTPPSVTPESPPYIEGRDGTVKVNVPLVGWVDGVKLPPTQMQDSSGQNITPEIVATDKDGNFLYLRNQKPLHKGTRSMERLNQSFAERAADINQSAGTHHPATSILGQGTLKLSDPEVFQAVANYALVGDPSTWDVEVWGVRFVAFGWEGERSGFLVSATSGRQNAGFIATPSRGGLTRKYTLHGKLSEERGFEDMGRYEVDEKWIGEPPVTDAEHQEGVKAQENQARRVLQD